MARWITFDTSAAATATITITVFTELNAGDKVNLVATNGTNYDFVQGDQSSVNGTFEATTSNNQTATNLMNVINTSSGPSSTSFTATVVDNVVTVTQATEGVDGNTTVTLTDTDSAGMTKTDFVGGTLVKYLYPINNINSVHLTSGTQIKFYARNPNQPNESVSDDVITITCSTDTAHDIYRSFVKQISTDTNETVISAFYDSNIISVVYAAGA